MMFPSGVRRQSKHISYHWLPSTTNPPASFRQRCKSDNHCLSVRLVRHRWGWIRWLAVWGVLTAEAPNQAPAANTQLPPQAKLTESLTEPGATPYGVALPNPDFTEADPQAPSGQQRPAGWQIEGGQGRWVDRQVLELQGQPKGTNYWRTDPLDWQPGRCYRVEFRLRGDLRQGCVISGPPFANRDWHQLTDQWEWKGFVFRVPEHVQKDPLRIGFWEGEGKLQCDRVRLSPVLPVHLRKGDLELGEGECIRDGVYQFSSSFDGQASNYHRTLATATAPFNTDRWPFYGNSQVTYRFHLPGRRFTTARVQCHLNYHTRGGCVVEASRDNQHWQAILRQEKVGQAEAALPADLLPAEAIWIRFRTADPSSNFQVNQITFTAGVDPAPPDTRGQTLWVDVGPADLTSPSALPVHIEDMWLEVDGATGQPQFRVNLANLGQQPVQLYWTGSLASSEGATLAENSDNGLAKEAKGSVRQPLQPGQQAKLRQGLPSEMGRHLLRLMVEKADQSVQTALRLFYDVSDYYRTDYGQLLWQSDRAVVWWCEAGWKVPRQRPAPASGEGIPPDAAAQLAACRNDREAVQVVIRPVQDIKKLSARISDWVGPDGARIPASQTKILYIYYHYIHTPTDRTGVRDWWPDALPPLQPDQPLDVPAGQNQPLWILVHVPKDTRPGLYQARLALQAEGLQVELPLRLQVWDFTLPDRNRLETAFGLAPDTIFQYHNLTTDEQKRQVLDMYFQSFAEHRISPYDPTPLDPIRVRWLPEADPPRAEVDFSAFDPAMEQALKKYHFNTFMLPVQGMGGGTFHERYEPAIGPYGEKTPQYQAMFSSYVQQLENHLRAKGWLPMAYVYWFDEPDPKDYAFVTAGMERLKRYAPGLRRMLTEEPNEKLQAPVDIWCPVSFNYNHQKAETERAKGAIFWWYVCCGPKAPYCTLFIDHPATELRVWLWQTWQRRIQGILVWSTNYWTSNAAYPHKPQNPYEDPMGYVSGYSTPEGVKLYWGNGDGRFLYPPLAAAVPRKTNGPVLEPPVASIRWEMLREGVEDYEYMLILQDLLRQHGQKLPAETLRQYQALLEVPPEITKDMTTFTTDPRPIHAHRAKIAQAIEALMKIDSAGRK